jgi:hypothetical protein
VTVEAVDAVGNVAEVGPHTVLVDPAPPRITGVEATGGGLLLQARDATTEVTDVRLEPGEASPPVDLRPTQDGGYRLPPAAYPDPVPANASLVAVDRAGNQARASLPPGVDELPRVLVRAPAPDAETDRAPTAIEWRLANAPAEAETTLAVRPDRPAAAWSEIDTVSGTTGTARWDPSDEPSGDYQLRWIVEGSGAPTARAIRTITWTGGPVTSPVSLASPPTVGEPVALTVDHPQEAASLHVIVDEGDRRETIALADDGQAPDLTADDGRWTGTWTPTTSGNWTIVPSVLGPEGSPSTNGPPRTTTVGGDRGVSGFGAATLLGCLAAGALKRRSA